MQRELVPLHTVHDLLATAEMSTMMMLTQTGPLTSGTRIGQLTSALALVTLEMSRVQALD